MSAWAIVVAAGTGSRLGASEPKALVALGGRPMLAHALDAIAKAGLFDGVVVACGEEWADRASELVRDRFGERGRVCVGGSSRQESVRLALDRVAGDTTHVVVHDAARPLAAPELFARALSGTERAAGAVCAIAMADTVKRTDGDVVAATVDRGSLWRAQTPQAFRLEPLLRAHADAARAGVGATDDAALLERIGELVVVVPGDERNIKVTTTHDLAIAEALLAVRTAAAPGAPSGGRFRRPLPKARR